MYESIGIVGLGLMGGSLAQLLRETLPDSRLFAVDPAPDTRKYAQDTDMVDAVYADVTLCDESPDLVFICTPISSVLDAALLVSSHFSGPLLISDIASVKTGVALDYRDLSDGHEFVPGHPMAGSELVGVENASKEMLRGAPYALVESDSEACETFASFLKLMGFRVISVSPDAHDAVVGYTSHLSYLMASVTTSVVSEVDEGQFSLLKNLIGPGFKDTTRVAGSSPDWGTEVVLRNQDVLYEFLDRAKEQIDMIQTLLRNDDADQLKQYFSTVQQLRAQLLADESLGDV